MFNLIKKIFIPKKTKTVLVIDDSPVDLAMAVSVLKSHFFVLTAINGQEGLSLAKEKKPDVILLDFMMPGMKGPEVCEHLKRDDETKAIPVIFLTSLDTPASILASFDKGADSYLNKPVNRRALFKQIKATFRA